LSMLVKLGLEGIVAKRKDAPYRSGRVESWLKLNGPRARGSLLSPSLRNTECIRAVWHRFI